MNCNITEINQNELKKKVNTLELSDGEVLAQILKKNSMTVNACATYANVPRATIYNAIKKKTNFTYEVAFRIADALSIPVAEICKSYANTQYKNAKDIHDGSLRLKGSEMERHSKVNYIRLSIGAYLNLFNNEEMNDFDELIRLYSGMNDEGRKDLIQMAKLVNKHASAPKRKAKLKNIAKWRNSVQCHLQVDEEKSVNTTKSVISLH